MNGGCVLEQDLKELHAIQLDLLHTLDAICKKHNIRYSLFAGSALGAVRHQGFIPWDDDLDVVMPRPEYERFLRVAGQEIDKDKYFLQCEFSPHWPMFFSKLRAQNTTYLERYHPRDWQTNMGIYIDIFPCDNLADRPFVRRLQFAASKVVIAKSLYRRGYSTDSLRKKAFMAFCCLLPQRPFLALAQLKGHGNTKMVHTFFGGARSYAKNIFPRSWLANTVDMPFEDGAFPVTQQYDALLRTLYGNYMQQPSEEERACKVHAMRLDCTRSYKTYEAWHRQQKIDTYERSIR